MKTTFPFLAAIAALALAGCGERAADTWSGYVEGDFVYVSAPIAGTVATLAVEAGQQVKQGQALFALESETERAARAEAEARLATARYQAANTDKGRRPPEVAVTQAQLQQARAQADLAQHDLRRKRELAGKGFIAAAQVDEARTAAAQAQAHVAELSAALQVAKLPARPDERAAAGAQVEVARQVVRQNSWRERQTQQVAPADALVSDTYFRPGEFVGAGQPVVALLPPSQVKARFYVPQADLAKFAPGQKVTLQCDGCGPPIPATVTRTAAQPEYTPPVIYSNEQRSKLVFMVEAKPQPADAQRLRPGQPLDVRRAEDAR